MLEISPYSLVIQIINFLVLLLVMNILLYRPIRNILKQRNEEMGSLESSAEDFRNRSDQQELAIEDGRIQARKEGIQEKDSIKAQGSEKEAEILKEAHSEAEDKIGLAKKEMEDKMGEIQKSLESDVDVFADELAAKILGRSVQ
jgi:F-type H+-transporting ATPase subunit b